MADELSQAGHGRSVTRRRFVEISLASGAALVAGKSDVIFGAESTTTSRMATNMTFKLGDDLTVNRLGFGAMRITGEGIWGWPPDRENALKVLRRAVELDVNLIDTHRRSASSLPERTGYRDQRRTDSTGTGGLGTKLPTRTS